MVGAMVPGGTQSKLPPWHEAWLPKAHPLHRPRHGTRQLTAMICACVFFTLPLTALLLGMRPTELENRRLAAFPSPANGWGFFTAFPGWASDYVPFRRAALDVEDGLSRNVFGEPPNLGHGGTAETGPGPTGFDQQRQVNPVVNVPLAIE